MDCSMPGFPVLHHLPEFAQTHIHWIGEAIQPSHLLSPSSPPPLKLSQHQDLFLKSAICIRGPKYWSCSISPSNEYSGLISFRMDLLDLLAFQGILKSFFQQHISKTSILWLSALFMVQLSYAYMTTGKIIPLTIQTFVCKVRLLSRFATAFPPKSKCYLIAWMKSPSTVILEPKNIKSVTVFTFSPSICQEMMGLDAMVLVL